jgi:hypothetical protein
MKRIFKSKKALVLLAVSVAAIAAAFGAFAYFTATGSGQGSATVGSSVALDISGTTTGDLVPAGPVGDVAITIKNNTTAAERVNTVSLASISAVAGCDTSLNSANSAFTFVNPVPVGVDLQPGGSTVVHQDLQMNDTGVSQDGCQGASLTLHFTSN